MPLKSVLKGSDSPSWLEEHCTWKREVSISATAGNRRVLSILFCPDTLSARMAHELRGRKCRGIDKKRLSQVYCQKGLFGFTVGAEASRDISLSVSQGVCDAFSEGSK